MNEINIVSDAFTAEELKKLLAQEVSKDDLKLELKKNSDDTLALDPTTLVALATITSTVLTTLVTQLFAIWQKKLENKGKSDTTMVKIKTASGGELVVSQSIAENEEKLQALLKTIEGTPVKQVGLITNL